MGEILGGPQAARHRGAEERGGCGAALRGPVPEWIWEAHSRRRG